MRVSVVCRSCRLKKTKCIHDGKAPCHSCRVRGKESTCILHSTQEFRKLRKTNIISQGKREESEIHIPDAIIKSSIEFAFQHYPELFFLSSLRYQEVVENLDELVILGVCVLSAPFTSYFTAQSRKLLASRLEVEVFGKIDGDPSMNLLSILQVSILVLLLNWQNRKMHKGYLLGGFAERAFLLLSEQDYRHKTYLEKEFMIRTLWSYQLITISLRKGSLEEYKTRLCKFPLPQENSEFLFRHASEIYHLKDFESATTHNIFALFIAVTELWADCSSWVIQGGRQHFLEAPWDETSEWYKLDKRLNLFKSQLGPKESLNIQSMDAFFSLGQGTLYCCTHLALLTSKILIHRNYMPFIPPDSGVAKGPTDPSPALRNPPRNWWSHSARTVFEYAREAALIFNEFKKRGVYCCSTFAGFVALTCASTLFYIDSFPSYDPGFKDAALYYGYCVDFLKYYKNNWELGSYYYQFLVQTVAMFKAASDNKLTTLSISVFENMKDELVDVANVAAPSTGTKRIQIENLIDTTDVLTHCPTTVSGNFPNTTGEGLETWMNQKNREKLCSLFGWENEWPAFDNINEYWGI
ncbi:hypothetical protein BZL39_M00300 [Zygosaccharomyces parabailii]|nr:hypothetical protein BZL39_M00300 [Zygosaccharomyces parabailii]